MKFKISPLEPDCIYHIYNRANGNERIFLSEEDQRFFMDRYRSYILPFTDLLCYCLMPNHFHFLVRVKGERELAEAFKTFPKFQTLEKLPPTEKLLSKQFSNLFSSYTQAFNKVEGRKGSLFMKNFKRIRITDEKYLLKLIHYIHLNPAEAGLALNPLQWKFSSYPSFLSKQPTSLRRKEVIGLFGDLENFIHCHNVPPEISGINDGML